MNYGITEVFVKHDYYSKLRIKFLRKEKEKLILLKDKGDSFEDVKEFITDKKIYSPKENFHPAQFNNLYYIYEIGEYSVLRYKYIMHEGSSRSSKSFSLEEASIRACEENKGLRINIWRDTKESLAGTIWADFKKVFPLSGRKYKFPRNTVPIYFENDSRIEPHGADSTNAHGTTQDIAWLNEPYKVTSEAFSQISMRSNQVWFDLNPKESHWSDIIAKHPRCKLIHSTFIDNPFCPPEQKAEIISYNPDIQSNVENGTADKYKWQVYGLGMKAERPNRIFRFKEIPYSSYLKINTPVYYGVDWGVVDPMGILEAKYYDRALYLHELSYKSENDLKKKLSILEKNQIQKHIEEGFIMWYFRKLGIDYSRPQICDSNRPNKVIALRKAGFENAITATKGKGSIIDGIDILNNITVYYTHTSLNLKHEQENYSRLVDKRTGEVLEEPEDLNNHLLDPTRYIVQFLIEMGILNIL